LPEGQVHHQVEEQKTRASFGAALKKAAEQKDPIYRKNKVDIDKDLQK